MNFTNIFPNSMPYVLKLMKFCYRMQSFGIDSVAQRHRNKFLKNWDIWTNFLEENRQHIFYIFVFYVIIIGKINFGNF